MGKLEKHHKTLEVLETAKPKLRKSILENAETDLIRCICECCHNILKGNVELTTDEKRVLCHHKKTIRDLSSKKISLKRKRDILVQKGGFLPALLGPILSIVTGILGGLLK